MIEFFLIVVGIWLAVLGAVVGSFANVCIYRIPWQKSVIWPGSHCPRCWSPIRALDNIPVVGWLVLNGRCRTCHNPIPARYALIEALVACLFVATFLIDVVLPGGNEVTHLAPYLRMAYHLTLISFLVVATFIDYDLQIIPDAITMPGMIAGLVGGTLAPGVRPDPSAASTPLQGLLIGLLGLAVGAGLTQAFRLTFSLALRREAMGFGDVTLMALIGSFLGWQAAILCFFLAPFFGLLHAALKVISYLQKRLIGHSVSSVDREMPFGPYLSMAALALILGWSWIWPHWAKDLFASFRMVLWFLLTGE
jgi:leader peptidase (prepilin peptidase)/N-methyltransferase